MEEKKYRSAFTHWDRQASVCKLTLETLSFDECEGSWLFAPRLVPWSMHPLVTSKGPQAVQQILGCHLLDYLDFTDRLENELISPVCYMLARREAGFDIPGPMAADARKMAVDEMYHALMMTHLASQVAAALKLDTPHSVCRHPFLQRVEECLTKLPPGMHALLRFMAAGVSETLITGALAHIPNDGCVAVAVRNTLRSHAEDEARHCAYFCRAIEFICQRIPPEHWTLMGPLLPSLAWAFVSPNPVAALSHLRAAGLSSAEAQRVLAETKVGMSYDSNWFEKTLRCFFVGAAFQDKTTLDACRKAGLNPNVASSQAQA